MESLPLEIHSRQNVAVLGSVPPIDRIAKQRVADRGHVDTHLMRSPRLKATFDHRCMAKRLD